MNRRTLPNPAAKAISASPNKIAFMDRGGGVRVPHFYRTAPDNVLIEVCTPPGGLAEGS